MRSRPFWWSSCLAILALCILVPRPAAADKIAWSCEECWEQYGYCLSVCNTFCGDPPSDPTCLTTCNGTCREHRDLCYGTYNCVGWPFADFAEAYSVHMVLTTPTELQNGRMVNVCWYDSLGAIVGVPAYDDSVSFSFVTAADFDSTLQADSSVVDIEFTPLGVGVQVSDSCYGFDLAAAGTVPPCPPRCEAYSAIIPMLVVEESPVSVAAIAGDEAIALSPPVPNPFRSSVTIEYSLRRGGPARLSVFDLQGRLVSVLRDEEDGAGSHTVTWDGRDLSGIPVASGKYFYRLSTPDGEVTRPVVRMR